MSVNPRRRQVVRMEGFFSSEGVDAGDTVRSQLELRLSLKTRLHRLLSLEFGGEPMVIHRKSAGYREFGPSFEGTDGSLIPLPAVDRGSFRNPNESRPGSCPGWRHDIVLGLRAPRGLMLPRKIGMAGLAGLSGVPCPSYPCGAGCSACDPIRDKERSEPLNPRPTAA
jgi:hypothetical protein